MVKKILAGLIIFVSAMVLFTGSASAETYKDFEYLVDSDGTCKIIGYSGDSSKITIPSEINGKTVTAIGGFSEKKTIVSVTIPKTVKTISNSAFNGCTNLKTVTMKKGVETIDSSAFLDCTRLSKVTIPSGVTSIGYNAFKNTKIVNDQTGDLVYVGKWLVGTSEYISGSVKIKDGTVGIAGEAFVGRALDSITFPDSIKYIGDYAFEYTQLKSLTLPEGLKTIGNMAFYSCQITSVTIPKSVESIGDGAFHSCSKLEKVTLPSGVKSVGAGAFSYTPIVNNASGDVVYIGKWLVEYKNKDITSVKIKDGTVGIADSAFWGCNALKKVTIPSSVTYIGRSAFEYCSLLKSVTIPKGIKEIYEGTFRGCKSLESVSLPSSVRSIGRWAFSECASLKSVSVPKSAWVAENAFPSTVSFKVSK